MRRISHPRLHNGMALTFKLRKEAFKKDYELFLRETAREAAAIDRHDAANRSTNQRYDSDAEITIVLPASQFQLTKQRRPNNPRKSRSNSKRSSDRRMNEAVEVADDRAPEAPKKRKGNPDCLNPKCDKKHFLMDCSMTSAEEKKQFLKNYWESKKKRMSSGHVGMLDNTDANTRDHYYLFTATFCHSAVEATVLADQGSDACILPPSILEGMVKADQDLTVTQLRKTIYYETVNKSAPSLACSKAVKADVLLCIRHGTNFSLRNVEWTVGDNLVSHAILSRHVLQSLGLDNRMLLAAACERFNGVFDIEKNLHSDGKGETENGTIYSLLKSREFEFGSTFHSASTAQDDKAEDADIYIDLGEDEASSLSKTLENLVKEAKENGMSSEGCNRPTKLLHASSVFSEVDEDVQSL